VVAAQLSLNSILFQMAKKKELRSVKIEQKIERN